MWFKRKREPVRSLDEVAHEVVEYEILSPVRACLEGNHERFLWVVTDAGSCEWYKFDDAEAPQEVARRAAPCYGGWMCSATGGYPPEEVAPAVARCLERMVTPILEKQMSVKPRNQRRFKRVCLSLRAFGQGIYRGDITQASGETQGYKP